MKRIGIFSFYDKEGIADSYIEYLLNELTTVLDRLVVVVNGQVGEAGRCLFSRYTNDLIIRENKGYDAGAYADVIVNVLGGKIRDWDELVLCNDTFFGPFVPMRSIFEKMENKQLDFWGLNVVESKLLRHIQSYFLVFGARILQNGELQDYFRTHIDPLADNVAEVYGKFERGLFLHLAEKQYSYGAYCNTELCCIYESPDVCLERYGLPVLKKKSFSKQFNNAQAAVNAVRYLRRSADYDISHITRCVQRLYGLRLGQEIASEYIPPLPREEVHLELSRFSSDELDARIDGRDFYIYGTGLCGRSLYYTHLHKNKGMMGFVVSDSERIEEPVICGFPVFHYDEIDKNALIVLGIGKKLTEFLKPRLDKRTEYIELWE